MSGIYARLDKKTALRILCGRGATECDGQLAVVECANTALCDVDEARRYLFFLEGWLPREDGVWAMTPHATKQVLRGWRPSFHRSPNGIRKMPAGDPAFEKTASETGIKDAEQWLRKQARQRSAGHRVTALPVKAKCPKCGWLQTLDAAKLELDATERITLPVDQEPFVVEGTLPDELAFYREAPSRNARRR